MSHWCVCVYKTAVAEDMDTELWNRPFTALMANLHLYFTGCLLLLAWNYGTTVAAPARHPSRDCANSAPLFKSLLLNVSGLLKNNALWHGMNLDVFRVLTTASPSETVLACAPALNKTNCHVQSKGSFNEGECLKNIYKDLVYYEAIISTYIELDLRNRDEEVPPFNQTLEILHDLLKACSLTPAEYTEKDARELWEKSSYSNRQTMLKMMRAFHLRTITFNRAVGYIASGEHKHGTE